jgi:hypothetical protein
MKLLDPNPQSRLAYVPKWMFVIFGTPKHKNIPLTVQPVWSIYLQTMGITLALYGILLDQRLIKDPNLSGLLGLGFSMLLGIPLTMKNSKKSHVIYSKTKDGRTGNPARPPSFWGA